MAARNLVAVYETRDQAEKARAMLIEYGFADEDIRLANHSGISGSGDSYAAGSSGTTGASSEGGFFGWLFGSADRDQDWYRANLHGTRTAVSVLQRDGDSNEAERILEEFDPIDIDHGGAGAAGSMRTDADNPELAARGQHSSFHHAMAPTAVPSVSADDTTHASQEAASGEEVIPIVKEELQVGKRVDEQRRRVRSYTVETPVERQVDLRDERIVVERRPVRDGDARDVPADALEDRDIEVIERRERPVVGKQARVVEEVVLHKDVSEHTETVRDNLRETRLDIDEAAAGESDPNRTRRAP